ncbi:MAG: ABC transporter permease subunit, partial [Nocardioidaceae bacterium]
MPLLLAAVTALLLAGGAAGASAATPSSAASKSCVQLPPRNDDTIHFQGCLLDERVKPAKPVPGVKITVKDESGKVIASGTSDKTGVFDIPIPGKSIDNLGKTFTIHIDKSTLPEGAALRNPKQVSLKIRLKLDADVYLTFPIANDHTNHTGKVVQGIQLAIGGVVFSLLLAMAALGLSMIFGTTGLVNFAHGELITFGAMAAFFIDALPGDIDLGGVNITMVSGIVTAVVLSTLFGWGLDRLLWRPLRRKGVGLIAAMIVSIGLSIFLRNIYQYFAGAANHNYSQWTSPQPYKLGPFLMTPKDIGVIVFSVIVLVLISLAVQKTKIGKATRA